jgi:hypothetical protein
MQKNARAHSGTNVTLMYNFSKCGKHFIMLITTFAQSFTLDNARSFTLLTTAVMLAIVFGP